MRSQKIIEVLVFVLIILFVSSLLVVTPINAEKGGKGKDKTNNDVKRDVEATPSSENQVTVTATVENPQPKKVDKTKIKTNSPPETYDGDNSTFYLFDTNNGQIIYIVFYNLTTLEKIEYFVILFSGASELEVEVCYKNDTKEEKLKLNVLNGTRYYLNLSVYSICYTISQGVVKVYEIILYRAPEIQITEVVVYNEQGTVMAEIPVDPAQQQVTIIENVTITVEVAKDTPVNITIVFVNITFEEPKTVRYHLFFIDELMWLEPDFTFEVARQKGAVITIIFYQPAAVGVSEEPSPFFAPLVLVLVLLVGGATVAVADYLINPERNYIAVGVNAVIALIVLAIGTYLGLKLLKLA